MVWISNIQCVRTVFSENGFSGGLNFRVFFAEIYPAILFSLSSFPFLLFTLVCHHSTMSASSTLTTGLTEAEMEPVRNFLNNALQAKQNGQPLQYQIVVQQFKVKDDPETLWKVVIALNSFASLLTSR